MTEQYRATYGNLKATGATLGHTLANVVLLVMGLFQPDRAMDLQRLLLLQQYSIDDENESISLYPKEEPETVDDIENGYQKEKSLN